MGFIFSSPTLAVPTIPVAFTINGGSAWSRAPSTPTATPELTLEEIDAPAIIADAEDSDAAGG